MAEAARAPPARIAAFKSLAVRATARVAAGRPGFGMLLDDTYGRDALFETAKHSLWIGRPVEQPGSRPLRFEGGSDIGSRVIEWPVTHTVKCLAFYHPDDDPWLKAEQGRVLRGLHDAVRRLGRELLIEIIAGRHGMLDADTLARALGELYDLGIRPDWWKLEPQTSADAWAAIGEVIASKDPWCRGVVLLGLDAGEPELERAFRAAANAPIVRGFAIGRTLFSEAARHWLDGTMDDEAAIDDMAERFARLVALWEQGRAAKAA
jgi:5-dehydro-2-deoxygluconokinase